MLFFVVNSHREYHYPRIEKDMASLYLWQQLSAGKVYALDRTFRIVTWILQPHVNVRMGDGTDKRVCRCSLVVSRLWWFPVVSRGLPSVMHV